MPTELSPTARALRALEILQTRPGTTADQLADRLGVTQRAARRYIGILREAGIPIDSIHGPHGGYRLRRATTPCSAPRCVEDPGRSGSRSTA